MEEATGTHARPSKRIQLTQHSEQADSRVGVVPVRLGNSAVRYSEANEIVTKGHDDSHLCTRDCGICSATHAQPFSPLQSSWDEHTATALADSTEGMFRRYGDVRPTADSYSSLSPALKRTQTVAGPPGIGRTFVAPTPLIPLSSAVHCLDEDQDIPRVQDKAQYAQSEDHATYDPPYASSPMRVAPSTYLTTPFRSNSDSSMRALSSGARTRTIDAQVARNNATFQHSEADWNPSTVCEVLRTHIKDCGVGSAACSTAALLADNSLHESLVSAPHVEIDEEMSRRYGRVDLIAGISSLLLSTQADTKQLPVIGTCAAPDELRTAGLAIRCLDTDNDLSLIQDKARIEADDGRYSQYTTSSTAPDASSHLPTRSSSPAHSESILSSSECNGYSYPSMRSNSPIDSRSSLTSPRAAMLAATLPQELVFMIVDAAGLLHRRLESRYFDPPSVVLCCALVCIEWAKRFRPLVYGGRNVVKSERGARRLRDLVMGPCSDRLTPLVELIGELVVHADPDDKRSWHRRLISLARIPKNKLAVIRIYGNHDSPVFRSLHWGIPSPARDLPSPYRRVELRDLRFASVEHISQIVRKLPRLEELGLYYLRWAEDTLRGNTAPRQQARSALTRVKVLRCHDASLLLLRLLLIEGSARVANPLQVLPPPDQSAIIQLVERFTANAQNSRVVDGYFAHHPTLSSRLVISHSVIVLRDYDSLFTSLHLYHEHTVIGCAVVVLRNANTDALLSAIVVDNLWSTLALFPNIRYLIVGVSDLSSIQLLAETHQALWNSLTERLWYFRFASQPKPGEIQEWVAHDPVSLEMTGEKWTDGWWYDGDHGAQLNKIVSAQMEANCTALDHCA